MNKLEQAWHIAQTEDVSSLKDSIVLYSISYLKTDKNKRDALQYIAEHKNCMLLDQTPCGKKLIELGLETDHKIPDTEIMKIWSIASVRFIKQAAGDVTAFVEGADKRSVFVSTELPQILKNPKITKINGIEKQIFAKNFKAS